LIVSSWISEKNHWDEWRHVRHRLILWQPNSPRWSIICMSHTVVINMICWRAEAAWCHGPWLHSAWKQSQTPT
jgi:hypothetical protein